MPEGNLQQYAIDAEANLEALATGLAKAGAPEEVVDQVSQLAAVSRKLVQVLGKGQEETGDNEPPAQEELSPEEQVARQPAPPTHKRRTIQSAANELHQETMAAAAQRQEA